MMQSLLGQPSAVSQMLSLLANQPPAGQPGQPAPMPAAPMPNVSMAPPDPSQINAGMSMPDQPQSLLGKIHDYISDRLGIKGPTGYGGLLTPEEEQQAKPGILAALGGATANANANHILEMHQIATAIGEHRRIMQSRADMPNNLSLPDQLKYAVQHGDIEMIKTLGDPLSRMLGENPVSATERTPRTFTVNGQPTEGFSDKSGKFYGADGTPIPAGAKITPYVAPKEVTPSFTAVPGIGPDGKPTVFTLNTRTGKMESTGVGKPGSDNPQQQLTAARATAGIAEMNNANGGLQAYEDKLINGSADIKGLDQFIGSVGDSFTLEDPKSKALQAVALSKLNRENPELARYIRRGMSFAEGETGISQRPSDYRTKLAAFLSTASAGASPDMIADIRSRRMSILNAVNASKLAPQGAGKPKLTQAGYTNGRARGLTDAQLEQHYDLTGVSRK